ncbi:VirB4 family type IV secretion/conjugal transfer ATPase (plasmid) [Guyparkeria sp. 1SP6A2]|nr:VirB4 family type IV secretion/conjugal transfer ATPase [Guyparkeria sp. 1SP6A2]
MMQAVTRKQIESQPWERENEAAEFIPYSALIDERTVKTEGGDLIQVIKLDGIAHEAADDDDLEILKEQINILLRNIATPQVSLWSTIIRREETIYPGGEFTDGFDRDLNEKYRAHVTRDRMMVNELYLSIIYRPESNAAGRWLRRLERNREVMKEQLAESVEKLDEIAAMACSSLDRYGTHVLGVYRHNECIHSEVLEFLDYLVNNESAPRILPRQPLSEALPRSRPFFGADSFEIRGADRTAYGAMLAIGEYPEGTEPGLLNVLLTAPFPVTVTQSFSLLSRPVAIELLNRQKGRLESTGDLAASQIEALDDGLDDLASGRIVMGNHHLSVSVLAETAKELRDNVATCRRNLAESSMVIAREDWALAAAYWAQLPGNMPFRPRPAPISSRNFAGFSSFHNYPTGARTGNQWGPAVTMFRTTSGAPYYFNFHEPLDKAKAKKKAEVEREQGAAALEEDKEEQKALGNTMIIGPSGSGKTVVQGFLMAQSKKFQPTQVVFDKDRGLEVYVRASGGVYLPLKMSEPSGFNPFQGLAPTDANRAFLLRLLKKIGGGEYSHRDEEELDRAVSGVMELPHEVRRLSRVLDFLDPTGDESPHAKLSKWCESEGGSLAWVLDNEKDELDLDSASMFGFDVTEFLDVPELRTPIVMYLFHRIEQLIDGRRFQVFMDEFWKLLLDEYFEDFAQNKQKVIRKQNGIMVYGTQSPKDVLRSPIAHSLIEQCATMLFMPNPKASREDYVEGFHLTETEYRLIKEELTPGSRRFLIKQGQNSVVAELNLAGFDDELAVISGTTENVELASEVIRHHGTDPADWMPVFHRERS